VRGDGNKDVRKKRGYCTKKKRKLAACVRDPVQSKNHYNQREPLGRRSSLQKGMESERDGLKRKHCYRIRESPLPI